MRRSARTRNQNRDNKCHLKRKDKQKMKQSSKSDEKNKTKILENNKMLSTSMFASSSGQKGQKKNQKMKIFEESDASIPFPQNHQEEIIRIGAKLQIQPATEEKPVAKKMPHKSLLESVIDILQRTDRHDSFAQPIDANVVEGYYDIIKNPMDFGTMRAKLQEGLYTSMEEFEHDIFLVSNNAMLFNATATMYFRQARAIHELAKRVLHALKTDLKKFEDEFCLTRKPSRRLTRRESSRPVSKLKESRDETIKESLIQRPERTNQPQSSFSHNNESIFSIFADSEKRLVLGDDGIGYEKSLQMFIEGLGPVAKMVAARRLACLKETQQDPYNDNRVNKGKSPVNIDIDAMKQTDWLGLSVHNNSCYSEPSWLDPKSVSKLDSSNPFEHSSPVGQLWVPPAPRGLHNFHRGPSLSNARAHSVQEYNRHSGTSPMPPPQPSWLVRNKHGPSTSSQNLALQNQDTFLMPSLAHKGKDHFFL